LVAVSLANQLERYLVANDLSILNLRRAAIARYGSRQPLAIHLQIQERLAPESVFRSVAELPGPGDIRGEGRQAGRQQQQRERYRFHLNSRIVLDRAVTYRRPLSRRKYSASQRSAMASARSASFLPPDRIAIPAGARNSTVMLPL